MPNRVSTRRQFAQFSRPSGRGSSGPLKISYVSGDSGVAVAFAISRKVGNAVVRNRIRRRLRALIDGANPQPRAGNYLVRVVEGFGEYAYDDLAHHLDKALGRLEPRH